MFTEEQRKRYREYWEATMQRYQALFREGCYLTDRPVRIPIPNDLVSLRCEAKTRAGTPCKLLPVKSNGRCKFHGGYSTGPRTQEGKCKCALNLKKKSTGNDV